METIFPQNKYKVENVPSDVSVVYVLCWSNMSSYYMLYKLFCANIEELILLYKLVQLIFTQLNDKHDIFETFNDKQLRLNIVL